MFTLFRLLWLDRIHWVLLAFLSLRLLYVAMAGIFGIDLPWIAFRLLILQYIPWFALGICIYQITLQKRCLTNGQPLLTAATAVVTLAIAESALVGGLAGVCGVGLRRSPGSPALAQHAPVFVAGVDLLSFLPDSRKHWLEHSIASAGLRCSF
jgi:hypothetical protein